MDLGPFIEVGLYDPQSQNAHERRELLEHLVARGFDVDAIVARADGPATDIAGSLSHDFPARLPVEEIASRCGATVDDIGRVRAALGFPVEEPRGIPETFCDDFALFSVASAEFGEEATLGFARVVGAAAATMIEAARELFASSLRGSAPTELEISQANEFALTAWLSVPEVLRHLMVEWSGRDEQFELDLIDGDLTVGIAFVDLVGSTAWVSAVTRGDHAAAIARFEALASDAAVRAGARVVKFIGDEAMFVARDPVAVVDAAARLCAAVEADTVLPSARGAAGYGVVAARGGDYFGDLVNITARSTKLTNPGTIVVTQPVVDLLDTNSWSWTASQPTTVRGVNQPIALYRVERRQVPQTPAPT